VQQAPSQILEEQAVLVVPVLVAAQEALLKTQLLMAARVGVVE
jgi:hypothetical protein